MFCIVKSFSAAGCFEESSMKAAVLERPCVHPISLWGGGVLTLLPGPLLLEETRYGASCREAPRDIDRAMLYLGHCSAPPTFNYGNKCIAW